MFRFILLFGIIYILIKWLRQSAPSARKPRVFEQPGHEIEEMVQDPICGTYVPSGQAITLAQEKETLYFCSNACREKFLQQQTVPRH
jgi:uncharacterized protein